MTSTFDVEELENFYQPKKLYIYEGCNTKSNISFGGY